MISLEQLHTVLWAIFDVSDYANNENWIQDCKHLNYLMLMIILRI